MEKKKILLVLKSDPPQNEKLIEFVHQHFSNCSIDAVFLDYPFQKSKKRIGDYFKNLITNSNSYYNSNNKYILVQQEPLNTGSFSLVIDYYDMIVTNNTDYNKIITIVSSDKNRRWAFLPTLIIPKNNSEKLENVVFVSTHLENTIIAFKRFCYLFPSICQNGQTVLLRFMDNKEEVHSSESEKLLFEYFKTKCLNFSIHKVNNLLQAVDTKAINVTKNTLFVIDKPNIELDTLMEEKYLKDKEFASFCLSA